MEHWRVAQGGGSRNKVALFAHAWYRSLPSFDGPERESVHILGTGVSTGSFHCRWDTVCKERFQLSAVFAQPG